MNRGGSAERRGVFKFDFRQSGLLIRAKMGFLERPRHLWLSQTQHLIRHRRGESWCPALKSVKTIWSRCLGSDNLQVNLGGHALATSSLRSKSWQPCSQECYNVLCHSQSTRCGGRMIFRRGKGKPIPNSFRPQPADPDVVNFNTGLGHIVPEVKRSLTGELFTTDELCLRESHSRASREPSQLILGYRVPSQLTHSVPSRRVGPITPFKRGRWR